ncbi:hypothetical protein ABZX92_39525 [Lentzea sp. NPDC006480]
MYFQTAFRSVVTVVTCAPVHVNRRSRPAVFAWLLEICALASRPSVLL